MQCHTEEGRDNARQVYQTNFGGIEVVDCLEMKRQSGLLCGIYDSIHLISPAYLVKLDRLTRRARCRTLLREPEETAQTSRQRQATIVLVYWQAPQRPLVSHPSDCIRLPHP